MTEKVIFLMVLVTSFFQILHIFEEVTLDAYTLHKGKNSRGIYLRIASVMILLNFIVLFLLYIDSIFGYYAVFYTILISVGNIIIHTVMFIKNKEKKILGYGFPTSIPLGISGMILTVFVIKYFLEK